MLDMGIVIPLRGILGFEGQVINEFRQGERTGMVTVVCRRDRLPTTASRGVARGEPGYGPRCRHHQSGGRRGRVPTGSEELANSQHPASCGSAEARPD